MHNDTFVWQTAHLRIQPKHKPQTYILKEHPLPYTKTQATTQHMMRSQWSWIQIKHTQKVQTNCQIECRRLRESYQVSMCVVLYGVCKERLCIYVCANPSTKRTNWNYLKRKPFINWDSLLIRASYKNDDYETFCLDDIRDFWIIHNLIFLREYLCWRLGRCAVKDVWLTVCNVIYQITLLRLTNEIEGQTKIQ